jgi:hypothetical protein
MNKYFDIDGLLPTNSIISSKLFAGDVGSQLAWANVAKNWHPLGARTV